MIGDLSDSDVVIARDMALHDILMRGDLSEKSLSDFEDMVSSSNDPISLVKKARLFLELRLNGAQGDPIGGTASQEIAIRIMFRCFDYAASGNEWFV